MGRHRARNYRSRRHHGIRTDGDPFQYLCANAYPNPVLDNNRRRDGTHRSIASDNLMEIAIENVYVPGNLALTAYFHPCRGVDANSRLQDRAPANFERCDPLGGTEDGNAAARREAHTATDVNFGVGILGERNALFKERDTPVARLHHIARELNQLAEVGTLHRETPKLCLEETVSVSAGSYKSDVIVIGSDGGCLQGCLDATPLFWVKIPCLSKI